MKLPEGVEKVRAKGRTYYYWNPGRKTDREGERVRLHGDPTAPANSPEFRRFWTEPANAAASAVNYAAGSVGDLIECYRGTGEGRRPPSAEWAKLSGVEQIELQRPPQSLRQAGSVGHAGRR